jgi:hypothetical protein
VRFAHPRPLPLEEDHLTDPSRNGDRVPSG